MGHDLFTVEITNREWQGLLRKLQRLNTSGEYAPAVRVPTSNDTVMVVSPYPIGKPVDALHVELAMRDADPEWGNITLSGEWKTQAKPVKASEPSGRVFYGIVMVDQAVLEAATAALGLPTHETDKGLHWFVTPAQCEELVRIADCLSVGDYWARIRAPQAWDLVGT
jgi:hypothetical protein